MEQIISKKLFAFFEGGGGGGMVVIVFWTSNGPKENRLSVTTWSKETVTSSDIQCFPDGKVRDTR